MATAATDELQQRPHFLLIPYSEQGHINPMLGLASHLLRLRCRITFVNADRHLPPTDPENGAASASPTPHPPLSAADNSAAAHELLRFLTLPVRNAALCVDEKTMPRHQIFKNTIAGLEGRQDLVAAIVEQSKASSYPITCVVCDALLWKWVRHIVSTHHLHSAVLSTCSAFVFHTFYLHSLGKDEEVEELLVSQFGMPNTSDDKAYVGLVSMTDSFEIRMQKRNAFCALYEGIEECSTILVNSSEALEAPLLPSLRASSLHVTFIGPCLLDLWMDDGTKSYVVQQAKSKFLEDTTCFTWLDQQKKGSVLFVSFGSEGEIKEKQFEEIIAGIENSGYKFLWVLRSNVLANPRKVHSICRQSNEQANGLFVSWAPQARVLKHQAVGGFLTHSGWNSTLESLTFGVPMLCLPLLADQPYNANFVQNYLQVGVRLCPTKDGLVQREEVTNGVQTIMQGHCFHRVAEVQKVAQSSIQVAHLNLSSFIQGM